MPTAKELQAEIDALQKQIDPIQRKLWDLSGLYHDQKVKEFLETRVLSKYSWRLKLHQERPYLKLVPKLGSLRYPKEFDTIIEYPHDHVNLDKDHEVILNQDDGEITISFHHLLAVAGLIADQNLKIVGWEDLTKHNKHRNALKSLEKFLVDRAAKEEREAT